MALPILALIGWRLYRRVRSHLGPQPLRRQRLALRAAWLGVAALLILLLSRAAWPAQAAELAGLGIGAAVAALSLRLTRFETRDGARLYTPNPYIGIGVSLLLVGRLAYRFAQIYAFEQATAAGSGPQPAPVAALAAVPQTPATMALLGVFLGYFIAYNAGLLWRSRRLAQ
jgi:hypothetical protein